VLENADLLKTHKNKLDRNVIFVFMCHYSFNHSIQYFNDTRDWKIYFSLLQL